MSQKIVQLTADSVEERLGKKVEAFKPAEEKHKFLIRVEDTVTLIDAGAKTFKPVNRGSAETYLDLRSFLQSVGLEPETRS